MPDTRYLITFDDGGAGMRTRREPLEPGEMIDDCGERYRVVTVEPPPAEAGSGRAWAELKPGPRRGARTAPCCGRPPSQT